MIGRILTAHWPHGRISVTLRQSAGPINVVPTDGICLILKK